jgi:hypothetical protein
MNEKQDRGSALLTSVFVLALLSVMALILVLVSRTEVRMSKAEEGTRKAFYFAEAATERGRQELRLDLIAARSGALGPPLDLAAGTNDAIDFDAAQVRPQYSSGVPTGFTATGDDVPLVPLTAVGDGWYAAYVTNDPADGETNLTDSNNLLMLTGLGVGPDGAFEVVQSILQPGTIFPMIPATITVLGPTPEFKMGSGKGWAGIECPKLSGSKVWVEGAEYKGSKIARAFNGTDCAPYRELGPDVTVGSKVYPSLVDAGGTGGVPGLYMPTIGVVGPTGKTEAEDEMVGSKYYLVSDMPVRTAFIDPAVPVGDYQDEDTIADLTDGSEPTVIGSGLGTLNATWQDCPALKAIVEKLRVDADYLCTPPGCSLPATIPSSISFIDGDFRVDCDHHGYGMLVVTGELDFPASASWNGIIFVVGEGKFYRVKKEGYGNISGATVVADIAGPDDLYGTADDCTGGTGGFASAYFEEQKKRAKGTTVYCTADIAAADPGYFEPTVRTSFRQN